MRYRPRIVFRSAENKSRNPRLCCILALALLLTPVASWAGLSDGCPAHTYLGNNPGGEGPDWSEQAQGVANDCEHWFFTHEKKLFKYDANWSAVDGEDDTGKLDSVGFPPAMDSRGIDHFGDLDHFAGYLFVPFEDNKPNGDGSHDAPYAVIGVFRASDLAFVDWMDVTEHQQNKAGWVAIDPEAGVLYSSGNTINADTPLERYRLDLTKIENEKQGDFMEKITPIALLDPDGSPLSGQWTYMQGGVFSPWGDLYLSVGKAGDCPVNVHGGIHLFRRTPDNQAFQLIESSVNQGEEPACDPSVLEDSDFLYEYHPGRTGLGQEPEGLDWWNRDNIPGSRYSGQLHAILLDNKVLDDTVWLKHYYVDYFCVDNLVADANGPYNTVEGNDVSLDGTGSISADCGPLTYEWDLDYDGSYDDATGPSPVFSMVGQDGVFTIGLRVSDRFGFSDTDETTVTVTNEPPAVNFGSDQPMAEGAPLTITGTVTDPGWLEALTATADWGDLGGTSTLTGVLENNRPDATLTFQAGYEYGDNGLYTVEVCANDDDTQTCESIVVTILNVAPYVAIDAGQVTEIDEGDFVSVLAHFGDPGWLDTYESVISWGYSSWADNPALLAVTHQGAPGENPDNPDVGSVIGTRQFGDNGLFTVSVSVNDDDSGTGVAPFGLTVVNLDPTAVIDETNTVDVCGSPIFLAHAGEDVNFSGRSTDPGSDDLFLSWDWGDGPPAPDVTTDYLVGVPVPGSPDPTPSPEVGPRDVIDMKTHAIANACYYNVVFVAGDDDGGHARDDSDLVIFGNAELIRSAGYWYNQFRGITFFTEEQLVCYLTIVNHMSSVFSEVTVADTITSATEMMHPANSKGELEDQFDRQLMALWLNLTNGAIEFDEMVDTDFDLVPDTEVLTVLCAAEAARINPATTRDELEDLKDLLENTNLLDDSVS